MAGTPETDTDQGGRTDAPETLAELLFYVSDSGMRKELEQYRIKYETIHGPTDLTKRYTSTWPQPERAWLAKYDMKRYFDGLPPFAKAYLKAKMRAAAEIGQLDDAPDSYLRLYISGEMHLDSEKHDGRGR